jgi:feruloyl esterase
MTTNLRSTVAALMTLGAVQGSWIEAQARPGPDLRTACQRFAPRNLPNRATVTAVRFVPDSGGLPARCEVRGRIVSSPSSTINFRIDLPAPAAWNGKTLMIGGGGFDGVISTDGFPWQGMARRMGLGAEDAAGFAVGSTDSGHQGRGAIPYADYSWSARNPSALQNHASEANHLVLGVMVGVARSFYGKSPTRRYMFGVSNGGRQGLMAAQRHPEDYDGILAIAPAISQTAFAANLSPIMKHVYAHPDNWLDRNKLAVWSAAELAACDELDGLKDGLISDYRGCHFDPGTIVCRGTDGAECLTPGQAETIRLWMGPKHVNAPMADGLDGYAPYGPGGPVHEWSFLFGSSFAARDAFDYIATDNIVKTVSDDPVTGVMKHEPEKWGNQYRANSELIDATSPDLSRFAARGGKLLVVHGVGDYCVSYERTGQYFRAVVERGGAERVRQFFRYFVAPSIGHGFDGAGANSLTLFPALIDWVERAREPGDQVATKRAEDGSVKLSRPLCEYGAFPRYRGTGDSNKAESFSCQAY